MAQHDMVIDSAGGLAVRQDLNAALLALATNNSGGTAPPATYPLMFWPDTSVGVLKQRNAADDAWIDICPLSEALATKADNESVYDEGAQWVKNRDGTAELSFTQSVTDVLTTYSYPISLISIKDGFPQATLISGSGYTSFVALKNVANPLTQFDSACNPAQATVATLAVFVKGRWRA